MGVTSKVLLALLVLVVAFSYQAYHDLSKPFERPEIGENLNLQKVQNIQ